MSPTSPEPSSSRPPVASSDPRTRHRSPRTPAVSTPAAPEAPSPVPAGLDATLADADDVSAPGSVAWQADLASTIVRATADALVEAAPIVTDPLAAELLGSDACGVWWTPAERSDAGLVEREGLVGKAFAVHLERLGGPGALAGLRALQIGGADGMVPEAAAAAERLAAAGTEEPSWWPDAHRITPLRGARVSWTDDGHRFTSYLLEVDRAGQVVNMAVATVDDCSGVIGDILLFSDLDGFKRVVEDTDQERHMEWMGVGSVQARISRAIDRTDLLGTGPPPGSSEPEAGYVALRGLAQRWTAVAPPRA
jgi:hypothetical protein